MCVVSGVMRLQGHIYILCGQEPTDVDHYSFKSIRVYEETPPFDLLMLIPLEEVAPFLECAFDAALNCIYILDLNLSCIWKFTVEDHKLTKWLCNLVQPIRVTVSTDGQVVVLRHELDTSIELDVYASNSAFIRKIVLPNDIAITKSMFQNINSTFLIDGINGTLLMVTIFDSERDERDSLRFPFGFTLVSGNAPTAYEQIIGQVNHTFNDESDTFTRWQVYGSNLEFAINFIFSYCDNYLIVGERILQVWYCVYI